MSDSNASRGFRAAALILALIAVALPVSAQKTRGQAAIGFMAVSPNLTDASAGLNVADMLYGATVSYSIRPWIGVSTDILYLGDVYYGPGSGTFTQGPSSWAALTGKGSTARADWRYYETMLYAPLSINLVAPLGIVRPYIGAGPAFYFHFASTNEPGAFKDYLNARYGSSGVTQRIGQGLTARAGIDFLVADSFSIGAGYVLREDLPASLFQDLSNPAFFMENGYAFVAGRFVLQ